MHTKQCPFTAFNARTAPNYDAPAYKQRADYFIETAAIEERSPCNRHKVIVYHGEGIGVWLWQMLA